MGGMTNRWTAVHAGTCVVGEMREREQRQGLSVSWHEHGLRITEVLNNLTPITMLSGYLSNGSKTSKKPLYMLPP